MTLLLPLGLLGLLSIAVLILIYVLRPNYQQKLVSSTFVWKLSLQYKKNRLPISKLRNILILICQLLLLACIAFMMARPVIPFLSDSSQNEKVAVIDASASMMVATDSRTRFERAVDGVRELANETFAHEDGVLSVILAGSEARFLVSRATADDAEEVQTMLANLSLSDCGYASADIDGAAALAEEVLRINSNTELLFYTGSQYLGDGSFTVMDVSDDDDWNAAILNVTPVLEETNTYSFSVEVGCFGLSKAVTVTCELTGLNGNTGAPTRSAVKTEYFTDLEPKKTITFTAADFEGSGEAIVSFSEMYVSLNENDSFRRDNTFNVYGGEKPTIRVQYSSSKPNNFFSGAVRTLRQLKREAFNIELKEVSPSDAATEGYDLYIFEHTMPEVMPKDGVVILADPDSAPSGSGLEIGSEQTVSSDSVLASGTPHPITEWMDPTRITISKYRRILASEGYSELLYYNGEPVLLAKNEPDAKTVVLALDLNNSNLSVMIDFSIMMYNLFDYYLPATLTSHSFEVGETITLNARGENLNVDSPEGKTEFTSLPASLTVTQPGDYTVTQTSMTGAPIVEQFFVHIPAAESDISSLRDALPELYAEKTEEEHYDDLLMWFAAAALVLLTAEWLLHSRENL